MNPYASIHLVLLLVALTAPADPPAPVIIVAPGGIQPAPQPTPVPPAPIPTSVKLSGAEFEILTLVNYTGGGVTWDLTSPDFAVPVKLIELKPRESVIGIRAGTTVPDRHEAPDTPSVAVWPINTGTATVAAWGVGASGKPVKLATFAVIANQGPRPPPPKPDGALGLIKASRDGLAKVNSANKAAEALALAKAQRGIASAIAAGGVSQPAAILAAWRDSNRATVDGAIWKPWGEAASAALSKLYADGKLPDKAAWVAAFTELADGLEGK